MTNTNIKNDTRRTSKNPHLGGVQAMGCRRVVASFSRADGRTVDEKTMNVPVGKVCWLVMSQTKSVLFSHALYYSYVITQSHGL